jgi:hypothetical protein
MVGLAQRSDESADPLSQALSPPPGETPEMRVTREAKEAEARRVSDLIDEQIRLEKQANSRKKVPVKVLMLGLAESGACVRSVPLLTFAYLFLFLLIVFLRACVTDLAFDYAGKTTVVKGSSFQHSHLYLTDVLNQRSIQSSKCPTHDEHGKKSACPGVP